MENKKKYKELEIGAIVKGGTSIKNKTGSWKYLVPIIDDSKCINCMMCVNYCPENAISIKEKNKQVKRDKIDYNFCKGCGICAQVCPVGAISMHTKEDAKKLLKNKKYIALKEKKDKYEK